MADYVFRYRLDTDQVPGSNDPVLEMIRTQLENILDVVVPVEGHREVKIDGFKLLRDRGTIYRLFSHEQESADVLGEHPL